MVESESEKAAPQDQLTWIAATYLLAAPYYHSEGLKTKTHSSRLKKWVL